MGGDFCFIIKVGNGVILLFRRKGRKTGEPRDFEMKHLTMKKTLLFFLLLAGSCPVLAAPADMERNSAEETLNREQEALREEAARKAESLQMKNMVVPVSAVEIRGVQKLGERDVRRILPELFRGQVRIHTLSQQLQMANESGAASFHADFHEGNEPGNLAVTLTVKEEKSQHGIISVSNTGSEYTGDWRTTASYINSNLSGSLDSLGVAWVTSPDQMEDVQQGAVSYRRFQPKTMSSWSLGGSYSRVDLGNISPAELQGILDYTAKGESMSAGLHYQQYKLYTSAVRENWDLGLDYQRSVGKYGYTFYSTVPFSEDWKQDYHVTTASVAFQHLDRGPHHVFYWDAGVAGSLNEGNDVYQEVTPGSAKKFSLFRGNLLYQYRTKSNWIFGTRWQGQYTRQHLVSLAQLGAGGQRTVRGFEERIISADNGVIGSLEIYTPELCKGLRLVAFTDFAALSNNTSSETLCFGHERIASAGLGLRYNNEKSGLGIAIDYANIIDDVEGTRDGSYRRWNVNCSYKF